MAIQSNQPKTRKRKLQTAKSTASTQKVSTSSSSTSTSQQEERHRLVEETAYYIAERRGFQGDRVLEDWLQAEREVDMQSTALH